ncbi:MAG: hypothetical protein ACK40S_03585 [Burkholderiaceae bacterium]
MGNHPEMTAEVWKKLPGWMDNPAAVFSDPRGTGRLIVVAPETVAGYPVTMVVDPKPTSALRGVDEPFQLLVTAYAKTTGGLPSVGFLASNGHLKYLHTQNAPGIWQSAGVQFPRQSVILQGRDKILTEKHLNGYRRANAPAAFMGQPAASADSNARLVATQMLVDELTARWKRSPEIIVARNMQDPQVPQRVRDYDAQLKSQGGDGQARGFIYQGKVYLLSDELDGPAQIAQVLFHEVLGHWGLRGVFGERLTPILQQIGTMRRAAVVAKAREYGLVSVRALAAQGLDLDNASDRQVWAVMSLRNRLSAAEEVLAEMAQDMPQVGFVRRAIAAIRTWLREHVPGFQSLALTDDEIIRSYLLPARGYVTRANESPEQSLRRAMLAFGRWGATPARNYPLDRTKYGELDARAIREELFAQVWSAWHDPMGRDFIVDNLPDTAYFMEKVDEKIRKDEYRAKVVALSANSGAPREAAGGTPNGGGQAVLSSTAAGGTGGGAPVLSEREGRVGIRFNRAEVPTPAAKVESAVAAFWNALKTDAKDATGWVALRASFTKDLAGRAAKVLPNVLSR